MTTPDPDSTVRPVDYKGEPLDAGRGPGLGCFRFQIVVLVAAIILTPLSVVWNWPSVVSAALLFLTILLLLFAGQTIIFLLRLVAADRRDGRRRPLASPTPTVGELEDRAPAAPAAPVDTPASGGPGPGRAPERDQAVPDDAAPEVTPGSADDARPGTPGVRE